MTMIQALVNRFLGWKLPQSFSPDCYISFDKAKAQANAGWPTGTNLFSAEEARQMLNHVLPAMPGNNYATEAEGDAYTHGWFDGNEADPYGAPRWRHKGRDTHYTGLGVANLQTTGQITEGCSLMVYRGDDGQLWARPVAEFHDGRFEQVSGNVTSGDASKAGGGDLTGADAAPASNYDDTNPGDCPELNMSNYDHDDVATLNAWAVQADFCIERLERELAAARGVPACVKVAAGEVPEAVFAERLACARVAEDFMREQPRGPMWFAANTISARILGRSAKAENCRPRLEGDDRRHLPVGAPASAPVDKSPEARRSAVDRIDVPRKDGDDMKEGGDAQR